jgi:hypothetical protein
MSRAQHSKQSIGAVLILLGSFFLIDNLHVFPFSLTHYLFKWQVILIIIGSFLLATKPEKNSGIILLAIGALFLIPELRIFREIEMRTYWPIGLIAVGVFLLISYQNRSEDHKGGKEQDSVIKKNK